MNELLLILVTKRIPWVGAGIGIILGVGLVIANRVVPETPLISVRVHLCSVEERSLESESN